jgi:hypothetical protein
VILYPALSASVFSSCPALSASVPSFTRRYPRRCPFPTRHYLCRCYSLPGAICVGILILPGAICVGAPILPGAVCVGALIYLAAPTLSFYLASPASAPSLYPTVSVSVSSFTQCYLCWFLLLPSTLRVGAFILPGALGIGASPSHHVYRRSASAPSCITALCITSLINKSYSALVLSVPRHHFINPSTLSVDVFIISSYILALAVSGPSSWSYHTLQRSLRLFSSCIPMLSGQVSIVISCIHPITLCTQFRSL